jgi:hypothetical protein
MVSSYKIVERRFAFNSTATKQHPSTMYAAHKLLFSLFNDAVINPDHRSLKITSQLSS